MKMTPRKSNIKTVPLMLLAGASNLCAVTILVDARIDYVADNTNLFALGDTIKVSVRFDENNLPFEEVYYHFRDYDYANNPSGLEIQLITTNGDIMFNEWRGGQTPRIRIADEHFVGSEMTPLKYISYQARSYQLPGFEDRSSGILVDFSYRGENAGRHSIESPDTPLVFEDLHDPRVALLHPDGYLIFFAKIESYAMIPEPGSFGIAIVSGGVMALRRRRCWRK